ncbi:MAG: hypothetical protein WBY88_08190 [Desulfosarcina sp.]
MHFIDKLSKKLSVPAPRLTQANVQDLQSYEWPGNVRELENVVERAIILTRSHTLDFSSMNEAALPNVSQPFEGGPTTSISADVLSAKEMKRFERHNTINALTRCSWNLWHRRRSHAPGHQTDDPDREDETDADSKT